MFIYNGHNPESGEKLRKEFADEFDASFFARDNFYRFPKYTIIDDTDGDDEIIESDVLAADEEGAAMDNMFPDGIDEE